MQMCTLHKSVFGFYQLTEKQFRNPKLDIPELYGYTICLNSSDLQFPSFDPGKLLFSEKLLKPYGLEFGWTPSQVVGALRKPVVRIDNSESVPGHTVLVFKRMVGNHGACIQTHFRNRKLFLVIYEFRKVFLPGRFIARSVIKSMGFDPEFVTEQSPEITCVTDGVGSLLRIEEDILVRVRLQERLGG